MSDYITLMGSEEVSRAGYNMKEAAREMNAAANNMSHIFEMHQRFLDDWLQRFEQALENGATK